MKTKGFAVKAAGATSLALLLTTSAFADYRHQDQTSRQDQTYRRDDNNRGDRVRNNGSRIDSNRSDASPSEASRSEASRIETNQASRSYNRGGNGGNDHRQGSYRENDRVNLQGRVTSFNRENNGYRVNLDRGPAFWVPESYFRGRGRDLRVGLSITLGGIFRNGSVYVDDGGYGNYGNGYYSDGYVRGVVDRVDYRRDVLFLRDDRSGRIIEADLRGDRYSRVNVDDLRRGDFVELSGGWVRGDIFAVDRIDNVRRGRY